MDYRDIISSNIALKDRHSGSRCFIIGNGSSINNTDLSLLKNEITFVVNRFVEHDIINKEWQPTYYCLADSLYFNNSEKAFSVFDSIQSRISNSTFLLPLFADGNINVFNFIKSGDLLSKHDIFYMSYDSPWHNDYHKYDNLIDLCNYIPSIMNIAQLAIEAALYMGFSHIYLIGMDHDWLSDPSATTKHFYEGKNYYVKSYLSAIEHAAVTWKRYSCLEKTSKLHNCSIINATSGGFLDIFTRADYHSLFPASNNADKHIDNGNIETHLTNDEKNILMQLATNCAGKVFVEIGSYLGASSCFIASGIRNSGKTAKLFCVDTWHNDGMSEGRRDTYNDFSTNTASFKDIIVPLRGKSDAIAKCFDKEIDFLFIDAGHDYEDVKADVLAWFPKLRAGAQVVFHDIGWAEGVQQVVKEQVLQVAYNEGSFPNMYWACISQPLKTTPEETLSSLNQQRDPSDLIHRLTVAGIPITSINLDINDFISWLNNFREVLGRYSNSNDVIIEKCLEHYIADKFSKLETGHTYIDIAAAGSNWTDCLLQRGINAYCLDLAYPEGIHGNKIGANASETSLPDNSVHAMSLQCAFETFQGDYDKLFIRESKRILKEGGKVVISPLYIDTRHFILSSKNSDISSVPLDEGAISVLREDEYDADFSRHYSPEALANRIFSNLYGMSAKVFYIGNLDEFRGRFPGQRIYCDFILYLEKLGASSENQILLSVIIPTRNRAALLYNALESITKQTFPATRFEVIIADNGSSDATAEVCQHFKQRIPNLKYISAPLPGLHNGRHAGLKESIGEILVYADDDIEALPTWLEGVAESFSDPQVGLVGGKILPKFECQPPEWVAALSKKTDSGWSLGWYSILDFGDTAHEIPHEYIWGCNFSIRKNVLQQAGGFHPDSLPQELIKYRGDGETAVSLAVRDLGYKALYNPKASVFHVVSQKRLTQEYIYQRAYNQGISDSYSSIRASRSYSDVKQYNAPANTINDIVNRGFVDGFNYHQKLAKSDENLLAWILKESYINCEVIPL